MAKILIDLEDSLYKECKVAKLTEENEGILFHLMKCIASGNVLPEGHGRLIDADAYLANTPIRKSADDTWIKETYVYDSIMDTPTIIEADAPKRRKEYWEVN